MAEEQTIQPQPATTPPVVPPVALPAVQPTARVTTIRPLLTNLPFIPRTQLPIEQNGWLVCRVQQTKEGGDWCFGSRFSVQTDTPMAGFEGCKIDWSEWGGQPLSPVATKNHSGWLRVSGGWTNDKYILLLASLQADGCYIYFNPILGSVLTINAYKLSVLGEPVPTV